MTSSLGNAGLKPKHTPSPPLPPTLQLIVEQHTMHAVPHIIIVSRFDDAFQQTKIGFSERTVSNETVFGTLALVETNGERQLYGPYTASTERLLRALSRCGDHVINGVALTVNDDMTHPEAYLWHTEDEFGVVRGSYVEQAGMAASERPLAEISVDGHRCSATLVVFSKPDEPPRASAYLLPWALCGHVLNAADHAVLSYVRVKRIPS